MFLRLFRGSPRELQVQGGTIVMVAKGGKLVFGKAIV
jgi:hypothetical protein